MSKATKMIFATEKETNDGRIADMVHKRTFDTARDIVAQIGQEESVLDWIEEHGVTDDRMDALASIELKCFSPGESQQEEAKEDKEDRRQVVIAVLQNLMKLSGKPEKWYDAAVILDVYCCRKPGALQDDCLSVLCAALVNLLLKQDDIFYRGGAHFLTHTSSAVDSMLKLQGGTPENVNITHSSLEKQEHLILSTIQWRLKAPTVPDWMGMLSMRLRVFSGSSFVLATTPLWQYASYIASVLTWDFPTSADFLSRNVAFGTICVTCLASGLLSAGDLGLDESDDKVITLPSCPRSTRLQSKDLAIFLAALQLAARSDLESMKQDTIVVRDAILASPTIASFLPQNPPGSQC